MDADELYVMKDIAAMQAERMEEAATEREAKEKEEKERAREREEARQARLREGGGADGKQEEDDEDDGSGRVEIGSGVAPSLGGAGAGGGAGGGAGADDAGARASKRAMAEAARALPTVQRQKYEPPGGSQAWWDEEAMLMRVMEEENKEAEAALESEPIGVNELFVAEGFAETTADADLASKTSISVSSRVKRGYDLVRIGNINSVAFFHQRNVEFTSARRVLVEQCVDVLFDVAQVFSYNPRMITLFWQPRSVSRVLIALWMALIPPPNPPPTHPHHFCLFSSVFPAVF